ncbi:root meristem growth factor 10-like [Raphanus sativus]|uniref:Root meristem growth factor 10-like n=1 Tax=Raphanus sativus TaxID=3726 RepID=A0A9W3D3T7_RAPSA|nr:root meristem growth factor 10-like [Raphanus sativus]
MDPLRTTCFYFLFIVFFILYPSCLCDSRRLGPMEKKLGVDRDHLIAVKREITKQGATSTNETNTLLSEAPIEHAHGQINGNSTQDDFRVKRASLDKTMPSKRVSRTWKVPKYSKKQPRYQEHPALNLDYMQPSTHPPHHN